MTTSGDIVTEFGGVLRPESERLAIYQAYLDAGYLDCEAREMGWPSANPDEQTVTHD